MNNDTYDHAPGIRRSDLWVMNKSPLHFRYHMDAEKEQTKALAFGSAAHKYILEKDDFYNAYVIAPTVDRRTKEGKEAWARCQEYAEEHGVEILPEADFDTIREMAKVIESDPLAVQLLTGKHELAFAWTDPETGEECKVKTDCITEYNGMPYIVDYKTTDSCEDGHFERAARKFGYGFQAGMYCEGLFQNTLEEHGFAFVAQEKTAPYAVRVYICDKGFIERGYDKFRKLIGIYHSCKETGNWYGYGGPDGAPVELVEE